MSERLSKLLLIPCAIVLFAYVAHSFYYPTINGHYHAFFVSESMTNSSYFPLDITNSDIIIGRDALGSYGTKHLSHDAWRRSIEWPSCFSTTYGYRKVGDDLLFEEELPYSLNEHEAYQKSAFFARRCTADNCSLEKDAFWFLETEIVLPVYSNADKDYLVYGWEVSKTEVLYVYKPGVKNADLAGDYQIYNRRVGEKDELRDWVDQKLVNSRTGGEQTTRPVTLVADYSLTPVQLAAIVAELEALGVNNLVIARKESKAARKLVYVHPGIVRSGR